MKKSVAILGALLVASLFSQPSQAEEREIKSTGGASLGKWKYDEIDPADALLDVEHVGRRLISVNAGFIGNRTYKERWRFDNSFLIYDKLAFGSHYRGADFNEKDGPRLICGSEVGQKCDILKSEKVSKNLIIVTYRWRPNSAACAGLIYVDEEIYSEGYYGTYGDYYLRSVSCIPASDNHEGALALSAHYLSLVKKNGRPIARLSRYGLPKPKKPSEVPSRQGTRDSAYGRAPDNRVCNMATEDGVWQRQQSLQKWVAEARERGLSLEDCERVLKAK